MKKIEDFFIREQDFAEGIKSKILPFLNDKIKDGYFINRDGLTLHYQAIINPDEKAAVVISHGYCEFTTKYAELIYYFYQMGYSVFIIDHRGHGLSDRQVDGFCKVHVNHFEDYVSDFNEFIEKIVVPESLTERLILFAHSMGGAIAALYIEQHPTVFERAILSSPMIQMSTGGTSKFMLGFMKLLSYIPFFNKRYLKGYHDYDHSYKYPRCSALSKARYNYQYDEREREKHYQTNGCTYGWSREAINVSKKILKNASLVKIPVIIMQASKDALVMPEAQNEFASLAPNCKLHRFEGSKHEIFNATDDIILDYYNMVFDFCESSR
ncbi:alpha/beta hydrolase [Pseudobutyrivibrio ruminis]|uniref:alpha/beta hydrolase n=1 Tax=Pseudobutyrivibrio ruminis TaxID=46206 RepID=UPI00040A8CF9|nr:alpha/beta hydrolase [Pseudobutyrivibrio ruminis]